MSRVRDTPCTSCGALMWRGKGSSPEPICRPCRRDRRATWARDGRPCADCGRKMPGRTRPKCPRCQIASAARTAPECDVHGCSRATLAKGLCSTHYTWQWRQARGLISGRGTWIEPKRRLAIYERDGWVCQICYLPIAVDAPVNDDYAPSLDHITARSLGGGHESGNLRLAHRVCNAKRGAGEGVLDAA